MEKEYRMIYGEIQREKGKRKDNNTIEKEYKMSNGETEKERK